MRFGKTIQELYLFIGKNEDASNDILHKPKINIQWYFYWSIEFFEGTLGIEGMLIGSSSMKTRKLESRSNKFK